MAWCIPTRRLRLRRRERRATETALDDEALQERTAAAFARHGIDFRRRFSDRVEIKGCATATSPTIARGVRTGCSPAPASARCGGWRERVSGTALTAAQLAPKMLQDPQRWGAEYDHYMKQLLPIQDTFDYFV